MKIVTAIIQPEKLDAVRDALIAAEITRITVSRVDGHGRQPAQEELYRGASVTPNLVAKVRLDIACNDEFVKTTVDAVISAARTGRIGDGKIFVTNLEECIRISTGDTGGGAI